MTVPYTIRRAVTADAPSIAEIAVSAYRGYVAVMGREPAPMRADFQAHIDIDMVFVADATDGIAGYVVLCEIDGDWWLDNIATALRHHGRGLGRLLVEFAEDWRSRRTDRVQLYTNILMTDNLGWYDRLGYRHTGRRIVDGFDRAYFEKRLIQTETP